MTMGEVICIAGCVLLFLSGVIGGWLLLERDLDDNEWDQRG